MKRKSGWAGRADEVIEGVLDELPANASLEECEKAIRAAYPFGERRYHPYKVWLARVRTWMLALETAARSGMPRPKWITAPPPVFTPKKKDRETLPMFGA